MGNCLGYPPAVDAKRREKLASRQTSAANSLQGIRPVVLPLVTSFSMNTRTQAEETELKRGLDLSFSPNNSQVEVETIKLNSTYTSRASSFKRANRYIKRYRNEEEKLLDILHEREAMVRSAIKQGQELRAKCTRYREELDSLKALSDVDMTDLEWKRKYNELDQRNRDLKEELDILAARNKNGRDHLQHQDEIIQQLNSELQHERIEKQRLLSNSLTSLQSIGVKDKKGKLMITQLEVDNKLLQERLNDLTVRNQRGRDYLSKLEAEKRDVDFMVTRLKSRVLQEKTDKEKLQTRLDILSSTENLSVIENVPEQPDATYAQVQKKRTDSAATQNTNYETVVNHKENVDTDTKSTGFEIDTPDADEETRRGELQNPVYEEVGFGQNDGHGEDEPYITTYVMNSDMPSHAEGSGSITSTPRLADDIITQDPEPIWDYIPESKEMDVQNVTTRF